jgi:DNA-binding transcriptional LysR family regulator
MDLRRLELFVAVVDEGGMTKAAVASHVSQPALSQAIRTLEAELGIALFDRVGRRVRLTAAGEALLEPARQALRDVQTAEAAVMAVRGLDAGRLALGSLRTLAADPTGPLIGRFRAAHPAVVVQLADPDDPADLLDMVRAGDVELAITETPRERNGLAVHELADQELVAILPPGTRMEATARPLRRLAEQPFVATPPGTSSRRLLDDAFARAGCSPNIAVETAQREAILPLVLAGAGAALVPAAIADTARRLGAVVVACRPPISRSIVLAHRAGPLSPAADRFRALVVDRY